MQKFKKFRFWIFLNFGAIILFLKFNFENYKVTKIKDGEKKKRSKLCEFPIFSRGLCGGGHGPIKHPILLFFREASSTSL